MASLEKDTSVYFWTSQCTLSYLQWHCCPLFLTGSPRHSDLTGIHWRSRFGHHTDSVSSQRLKKQTVILIDATPEPLGNTLENWRRRRSFLNHLSLSFPETDAPWFLCFFCVKWSFFFFLWGSYFLVVTRCERCCWKSLLSFYFVGFCSMVLKKNSTVSSLSCCRCSECSDFYLILNLKILFYRRCVTVRKETRS